MTGSGGAAVLGGAAVPPDWGLAELAAAVEAVWWTWRQGGLNYSQAEQLAGRLRAAHELETLRRQYPGWRIWRHEAGGRVRLIAQAAAPGLVPHSIVVAHAGELRMILGPPPLPRAPAGRPGTRNRMQAGGRPAGWWQAGC